MNNKEYAFAAFTTKNGGVARYYSGLRWVEPPTNFPEIKVGEVVPWDWEHEPINEAARNLHKDAYDAICRNESNVRELDTYPNPEDLPFYLRCEDEVGWDLDYSNYRGFTSDTL